MNDHERPFRRNSCVTGSQSLRREEEWRNGAGQGRFRRSHQLSNKIKRVSTVQNESLQWSCKTLITWGIQVIGMQFTYNYKKISSKWCLIYSVTEQKKNSSTNQQIACALLVSRGAAAVPSSKSSVQQLAALMELEPALSSLPGGPQ